MSFPRYSKYKDSGVLGQVPAHWESVPIKHLGRLKGGAGFPHENQGVEGQELSFHKVNALAQAGTDGILPLSENTISRETAKQLRAFVFPAGTIVFAKVGAALLLGRIRILNRDACIDNNMMGLVIQSGSARLEFVRYAMSLVRFDSIANPGAVPSINESQIGEFRLPTPPPEEQTAIATFLDRETAKIDALVAEQQRLIELLKEEHQAVITYAVTKGLDPNTRLKPSGIEFAGEIPTHWKSCPLKWLTDPKRPIMYGIVLPGPDVRQGIPILKGGNVKPSRMNLESMARTTPEIEARYARARLKAGDLVYSIRGSIGDCEMVPPALEGSNITQDVARIAVAGGICANWVRWALLSTPVREGLASNSLGAAVRGVNIFDLKRAGMPTPPLKEQVAIAAFLDETTAELDALTAEAERAIDLLQEHRTALISAAVTGQIDVRGINGVPSSVKSAVTPLAEALK
jgi:type I restriction enzyme S subunit